MKDAIAIVVINASAIGAQNVQWTEIHVYLLVDVMSAAHAIMVTVTATAIQTFNVHLIKLNAVNVVDVLIIVPVPRLKAVSVIIHVHTTNDRQFVHFILMNAHQGADVMNGVIAMDCHVNVTQMWDVGRFFGNF
jgi:hypothetical protein